MRTCTTAGRLHKRKKGKVYLVFQRSRRNRRFGRAEMSRHQPRTQDRPRGLSEMRQGLPYLPKRPDLQQLQAAGQYHRHGDGPRLSSEHAVVHVLLGQPQALQVHERHDDGLPPLARGRAADAAVQGRGCHARRALPRLGVLQTEDQLRHALHGQRRAARLRLGGLPVPLALRLRLRGQALPVLLLRRPVRGAGEAAQAHALHSLAAGCFGGRALRRGARRRQQHAAHRRLDLQGRDRGEVHHRVYAGHA